MEIGFHQKNPPAITETPTPVQKYTYSGREITALPRELVEKILTNLGGRDLVVCKRVNRAWQDIVDSSPMLARAFYRRMHPQAPVPALPATIDSHYSANHWPAIRHWLQGFGEQGRKLVIAFDGLVSEQTRLFPERLFFSLARLLTEIPVFHCQQACTIQHTGWISQASYSPDGRYVITTSYDKTAKICQRIAGQWQEMTTLTHPRSVYSANFSPTGEYCVTICTSTTIHIWEVAGGTGHQWQNQVILPHYCFWMTPSFSADGNYLVTLPDLYTTQIHQLVNRQWQKQTTLLQGRIIHHALFHPREHILAMASDDSRIYVWRLVDKTWHQDAILEHPEYVTHICFSPDGNRLLITSRKQTPEPGKVRAHIYNRAGGGWGNKEITMTLSDVFYAPLFSANGDKLLTASPYLHAITIWQLSDNRWQELTLPWTSHFSSACFSSDGNRLVTTTHNTATLWRAVGKRWQEEIFPLQGSTYRGLDGVFSPYGHHLVTISNNEDAIVWGVANGAWQQKSYQPLGRVFDGSFSPDGLHFLARYRDHTATIWTFQQGAAQ